MLLPGCCTESDAGLQSLKGTWQGELVIPAVHIPVQLELPTGFPHTATETTGSIVIDNSRITAIISNSTATSLRFAAEQRGIYFTGSWPAAGDSLTGMLVVGRQAYRLKLLPEMASGGTAYTGSYRRPAEKQGIELKLGSTWLGKPAGYLLIPGRKRGAAIERIDYQDKQLRLDCGGLSLHFEGRHGRDQLGGLFSTSKGNELFSAVFFRAGTTADPGSQQSESHWISDPAGGNKTFQSLLPLLDNGAYPELNSLLIAHKDTLLLERYFNAYTPATLQDLSGITRSLTAMAAGHWLQDSLDIALQSFFPEIVGEHSKITIRHLLTMSSGLACNDWSATAVSNQAKLERQFNWPEHMMRLPLIEPPGSEWLECGGNAILLSRILEHLSGKRFDTLMAEQLFKPLQITSLEWNCDSYANFDAGSGLRLRPRDLLKIGRLLMQQGSWEGQQLIRDSWIAQLVSRQIALPAEARSSYGFYWWSRDIRIGQREFNVNYAAGSGGQFLMVIPGLEITCVFTAGDYKNSRLGKPFEWLEQHILPAVLPK